jgi:hypothetical protein
MEIEGRKKNNEQYKRIRDGCMHYTTILYVTYLPAVSESLVILKTSPVMEP